jgi:hypothetical protein
MKKVVFPQRVMEGMNRNGARLEPEMNRLLTK